MKAVVAAALFATACALPCAAAERGVEAVNPWSRPAAAGANGAGFVTLVNHGKADALVGVETPAAASVELHASSMSGGVMSMARETRVALPAGGQVSFAPGGRHIMLVGLKQALRTGDRVPATLRFASGATLKVDFVVSPTGPAPTDHAHMPGMAGMPGMR